MTFSFGDLSTIQASPGPWYSSGVPAVLGNGPYNEGISGFKSGNNTYFFGTGGRLERMITAMVVGYQPQVKITAGGSFATTLQTAWNAEGGLVIGPFAFGAAASGNTERDTFSSDGATVTLTNNGAWPYIVAFVSNWVVPAVQAQLAQQSSRLFQRRRSIPRRSRAEVLVRNRGEHPANGYDGSLRVSRCALSQMVNSIQSGDWY